MFGEISFFTGQPRSVTARSRGFTELMYLDQNEFLKRVHSNYAHTVARYEELRFKLTTDPTNLNPLYVKCYWCKGQGHIAINCDFFADIKGNMIKKDKDDS